MKTLIRLLGILAVLLMVGCASYQTVSLAALDPRYVKTYPQIDGLAIGCKIYSKQDCFDYFDRDLLAKRYQPIQLTFENRSEKSYRFSAKNISLPCVTPQKIAKLVHTSTVGRVLVYSVLGGLALLDDPDYDAATIFFTPAIVDGIKSYRANKKLDRDFEKKAKTQVLLPPGCFVKTVVFVPKAQFSPSFSLTLIEEDTSTSKTVHISGS